MLVAALWIGIAASGAAMAAQAQQLTGTIRDLDGVPVAGARVTVAGASIEASSDSEGAFRLAVSPPLRLIVSHPAFTTASVRVRADEADLAVTLRPARALEATVLVEPEGFGDRFSPNSLSSAAFAPSDAAAAPATLAEALTQVSGVAENGQGGLFQMFSIRGVSRQRIMTLFAGAPLTSERRAGSSGSFVDPLLVGEIDVLRGPASTYLGAGALGGAVRMEPRRFEGPVVAIGYDSAGDQNHLHLGWGDRLWSLGLVRRTAGDSTTPGGERLFSRFEQMSATVGLEVEHGSLRSKLVVLLSQGDDIGKPNADYPARQTRYPRERHALAHYDLSSERWRATLYVHPHDLETEVTRPSVSRQSVANDTFDFGGGFIHDLALGSRFAGRAGVDVHARRGVDARETAISLGTGKRTETVSLAAASETEIAAFGMVNRQWAGVLWEVGARATHQDQANNGAGSSSRSAGSAFAGAALPLGDRFRLVGSVGTGLRFPSLSEQFFTGLTGRGEVIGNPDLDSESSLDTEVGMRYLSGGTYVGVTLFRNRIDGYIERAEIGPGVFGFRNLGSGVLEGVEVDGLVDIGSGRHLSWGLHRIEGRAAGGGGRSAGGEALADVPADTVRAGLLWPRGRWRWRLDARWRFAKDNPGPGEQAIGSALLVDASIGFEVVPGLELALVSRNLRDQEYYPSADDRASLAAGRSAGLELRWTPR